MLQMKEDKILEDFSEMEISNVQRKDVQCTKNLR